MSVMLKKCLYKGCGAEFPAHYFHDYCTKHSMVSDNRHAQRKSRAILERHGVVGLMVNALSSLLPGEEADATRRLLYRRKGVKNVQA